MDYLNMNQALKFILLLGIVSLFGDFTYEGARSIVGPYLSVLGVSSAALGIIVGLGDFLGYAVRIPSGILSDKTRWYWFFTIFGFATNLFALPLLALTNNWLLAAGLIILERIGKGIRTPARDTMLSYATKKTGRGFGFGLHESLDQIGAVIGPLFVALILYLRPNDYRLSFLLLLIPATLSLLILFVAQRLFQNPQKLEKNERKSVSSRQFTIYLIGIAFVALGFANFILIAYHLEKASILTTEWIAFIYAIAMAVDGLSAFLMGQLFDTKGISILAGVTAISALFAPLVFLGGFTSVLIGIILWGIGMGSHESIMRAVVPTLIPPSKRGAAYGLVNTVFGIFWALGSFAIGTLYDISLTATVIFSLATQLTAIPFFLWTKRSSY
jgi:MFS family permease